MVKYLYSFKSLDPNKRDIILRSPFYEACKQAQVEVVKFLIDKINIDVNARNCNGYTALSASKDATVIELILDNKKIDPNTQTYDDGKTALMILMYIDNAEEAIRILLNDQRVNPNIQCSAGYTALHLAVSFNKSSYVELLMNNKNINPNLQNSNGDTALHLATENEEFDVNLECVEFLLKNKEVNPNIQNKMGKTPLINLSFPIKTERKIICVKLLLADSRTNPNIIANEESYALKNTDSLDFLRQLLCNNRINPNLQDKNGDTVLTFRSSRYVCEENFEAIKALLQNSRVDVNWQNKKGLSALHYAILSNSEEYCRLILSDPNTNPNLLNKEGFSPLGLALLHKTRQETKHEIIKMLFLDKRMDYESLFKEIKSN
jgi:ankyrin repeat protein